MSYKDKQGNEIDFGTWGALHANADYRKVLLDTVGGVNVLTEWHGGQPREGTELPRHFETVVTHADGKRKTFAASTLPEAAEQHARIVARLAKAVAPPPEPKPAKKTRRSKA